MMWPWAGVSKCQNQSLVCCSSRATSVNSAQNQRSGASPSPSGSSGEDENVLTNITSPLLNSASWLLRFFPPDVHSSRQNILQAHVIRAGELWVRMGKVHSLSHVTQTGLNAKCWTWSAVCTSPASLRSNYPNNSKPNELTVIYWFPNDLSSTFSVG